MTSGRHAAAAADPRHWAHWRREPLAYASGLLPSGILRAPHCYGVADDVVYLEDVTGPPEDPALAAYRLGVWQASAEIPDVPWLAGHQLAQRIAVSDLDWAGADPRLAAVWARREELLDSLADVPRVLSHGDFHAEHLIAHGDCTVVLDWGTLGVSPVGADLAHLVLSTGREVLDDFLAGLGGAFPAQAVRTGYRVTLALTAVSRIHWMLSRGMEVPTAYLEAV